MLFLAGGAGAADLISSLKQTFGSQPAPSGAPASNAAFGVDPPKPEAKSAPTAPTPLAVPLTPGTMMALLRAQGQDNSKALMALLDRDGNGAVSKAEFGEALGRNGQLAKADGVFAKLDANKDGNIDADEMSAVLKSRHRPGEAGEAGAAAAAGGGAAGKAKKATATERSINPDGSITTTLTYADGSKLASTVPAGASAGSAHDRLERLIQKQAQMLAAATSPRAGAAVSVSA